MCMNILADVLVVPDVTLCQMDSWLTDLKASVNILADVLE